MGCAYAWSPTSARPMNFAEADFWQDFYRRTRQTDMGDSPLKSLFESRFAFLNRKDESGFALRSLMAMDDSEREKFTVDYLERALPRFSGLEFARSHKMRSFSDMSSARSRLETDTREGLFRFVFEAAYLGTPDFVRAWEMFRDAFLRFRRGDKVSSALLGVASKLAEEKNFYARLRLISACLYPERKLSDWEENLPLPSAKALREAFSPYFSGRFLKDFELKNARDALLRVEKADGDEVFSAKLSAQILLERFELLRYKRAVLANTPEEKIEMDALRKLRDKFKGR